MPGTVTVGCKLPNGLKLQLCTPTDIKEYTIYGPRETKLWARAGKVVQIAGYRNKDVLVRNGYALTHGVDADFFEQWMKQNADSDLVSNGLIYAASKTADVEAHAAAFKEQKSGFEPADPKNLPEEFKRDLKRLAASAAA